MTRIDIEKLLQELPEVEYEDDPYGGANLEPYRPGNRPRRKHIKEVEMTTFKIASIEQTCYACPSQWTAFTVDGDELYLRFRHGSGRLENKTTGETIASFDHNDPYAGVISLDEFLQRAGVFFE